MGLGSAAALPMPTKNFNANANLATRVVPFTAIANNQKFNVTRTSNQIVVFRAVPSSAP